jgi:hypothetical protein
LMQCGRPVDSLLTVLFVPLVKLCVVQFLQPTVPAPFVSVRLDGHQSRSLRLRERQTVEAVVLPPWLRDTLVVARRLHLVLQYLGIRAKPVVLPQAVCSPLRQAPALTPEEQPSMLHDLETLYKEFAPLPL